MATTRKKNVIGAAAVAAAAALGVSAAVTVPAFAADGPAVTTSQHANASHIVGGPFDVTAAKAFQGTFTALKLTDGAKRISNGLRLGGGKVVVNLKAATVAESLKGAVAYADPTGFAFKATSFTLKVTKFQQAHLYGDVTITGASPKPIVVKRVDLADMKIAKGQLSIKNWQLKAKNVRLTLSKTAAALGENVIPAGTPLGTVSFSFGLR